MVSPVNTLIATHELADFDAFASLVAAQKLYPGAIIAIPRSFGRDVHPYFALHRDRFPGVSTPDVEWAAVNVKWIFLLPYGLGAAMVGAGG
jgi:tRNA nucleotidyltransferase (CCA-adding enzyme)